MAPVKRRPSWAVAWKSRAKKHFYPAANNESFKMCIAFVSRHQVLRAGSGCMPFKVNALHFFDGRVTSQTKAYFGDKKRGHEFFSLLTFFCLTFGGLFATSSHTNLIFISRAKTRGSSSFVLSQHLSQIHGSCLSLFLGSYSFNRPFLCSMDWKADSLLCRIGDCNLKALLALVAPSLFTTGFRLDRKHVLDNSQSFLDMGATLKQFPSKSQDCHALSGQLKHGRLSIETISKRKCTFPSFIQKLVEASPDALLQHFLLSVRPAEQAFDQITQKKLGLRTIQCWRRICENQGNYCLLHCHSS